MIKNMKAFVLAESASGAHELCAGARTMAEEVCLISVTAEYEPGLADVVYEIEIPEGSMVDDAYDTIAALCVENKPAVFLVEPTRRMKLLAGRIAAKYDTSVVTDVIAFDGESATNLYFGGIAHKKQKSMGEVRFYSVGAGVFGNLEATGANLVEKIAWIAPERPLVRRAVKDLPKAETDLTKSEVVVAAGRGFASEGDLQMARSFAERIKGDLGCTRPLTEGVDWLPRELYIGVSGLMLTPKTYVGIGLSGQMQHMVGVNRAKTIVAINKDKNAPIFKQADIGLVGDLYKVLPELIEKL